MYVLNTLAPVFAIIALGFFLRRIRFLSAELTTGINRLAYWVGLPSLLFVSLATAPSLGDQPGALRLLAVVTAVTLLGAGLSWLVARLLGLTGPSVGTLIQGGFRGNLVYVGLAVIIHAFGSDGLTQPSTHQTLAILAIGPLVVLYNVLAVMALLAGRHELRFAAVGKMLRGMATNPLLIACVAGVVYAAGAAQLGWQRALPEVVERTLRTAGQFALPVALLAIGSTVAVTPVRGRRLPVAAAGLIKLAALPLLGWAGARLAGLGSEATAVTLILMACPTAAVSAVLCDQLDGDVPLAAGTVVASTVGSVASLGIVLALL